MKIGMIGCGKLGLPVALTIESRGHEVMGYDVNHAVATYVAQRKIPYVEKNLQPLLDTTKLTMAQTIDEVVAFADLIFVAVQTPHDPKYEGATRLPRDRKDFDYSYLIDAITSVQRSAEAQERTVTLAVISTCLPGTFNKKILPLLREQVRYVYTPQFVAMGTVLDDYLYPEFNLIGVHDEHAAKQLQEFYKTINAAPNVVTDITTAEAIKVSYNTFVTMKTVLANTWGELCAKIGANVDDLFMAWSLSTKRLLSPRYLRAGMGDGGGCHPRDNIALSYIAQREHLSRDIFEDLMIAREAHAAWLADLVTGWHLVTKLPVTLLGRSFKPETNIETGSPALLVANILRERLDTFEHYEDTESLTPAVYVITTAHERYKSYQFPAGSVVIDPHRMIPDREDVTVIRIGDGKSA